MKRCCEFYVQHAAMIGALFCAVPAVTWFVLAALLIPFREVYVLRLALALLVGCPIAAVVNRHAVELWLAKHRGPSGPATVADGALNGALVGVGIALLPTLALFLISSSNFDRAKGFVILSYLASAAFGAILGSILAAVGRQHLGRGLSTGEDATAGGRQP